MKQHELKRFAVSFRLTECDPLNAVVWSQVSNTPVLVLIDRDGNRLTLSGVEALQQDPELKDFPWKDYQHVEASSLGKDAMGVVLLLIGWLIALRSRDVIFQYIWESFQ